MNRKEWEIPLLYRGLKLFPSSWPSLWCGEMPSRIAFLHTGDTSRRQSEEHGNQQRVQPAKETCCFWGKYSCSAAANSLLLFEVQPDCATYSSWQQLPRARSRGITRERAGPQLQGEGSSFWNHCCPTAHRGERSTVLLHPTPHSFFPKVLGYLFQLGAGTEETRV